MFNERWGTYKLGRAEEVSKAKYEKVAHEKEKATERRENNSLLFKSE